VTTPGPVARAAHFASLAHDDALTDTEIVDAREAFGNDDDPRVRAAALGALVRGAATSDALPAWIVAIVDVAASVRRRAADLAPRLGIDASDDEVLGTLTSALTVALDDTDVTVVEAAAWALGELGDARALEVLMRVVTEHDDPLAREASVAALGAIGDERALPAILHAAQDRPTVRRRAVLALAPFDGPDVDAAIATALTDKDWQVRQAAEDLTDTHDPEPD
jgi:HEAT repeat protein